MRSLRGKLHDAKPRPLTEVEHRRARTRLLEAAAQRSRKASPLVVLVAAFAVAGVVFVVHSHHAPMKLVAQRDDEPPPPKPVVTAAPPTTKRVVELPAVEDEGPSTPPVAAPKPRAALPGPSFDKAFAEFEKGNYGIADLDLESFLHEFPSDPRAEDAAYLRAVARYKLGDHPGAAVLARSYLRSYPSGLRRPEAERIAEAE